MALCVARLDIMSNPELWVVNRDARESAARGGSCGRNAQGNVGHVSNFRHHHLRG